MSDHSNPTHDQECPSRRDGSITPFDAARLRIGRQHGCRQVADWTEEELVRVGRMRRTWKEWGFPNGYDATLARLLFRALADRSAGHALRILESEQFGGAAVFPFSSTMDDLVVRTGLSERQLAEELERDWAEWRSATALAVDPEPTFVRLPADQRRAAEATAKPLDREPVVEAASRSRRIRRQRIERFRGRMRQCREWVSFADIAAWLAGPAVTPDEKARSAAYRLLGEAIAAGDFGIGRQSRVLCLHPTSGWAKITQERYGYYAVSKADTRDALLSFCWVPHRLAGGWFDRTQHIRPDHLFPAEPPKPLGLDAETTSSERLKPPFDRQGAKALLVGMKVGKHTPSRPKEIDAITIIKKHYQTAPRDPVREILLEIWGAGKRGPRKSAK